MSQIDDVEISRKTLERAEHAVFAQRRHVATMPNSHWKVLAQKNLAGLEEMRDIASNIHRRLCASRREQSEAPASMPRGEERS